MDSVFKKVYSELGRGVRLSKCRKCGCMRGTLENLKASLPSLKVKGAKELLQHVNEWFKQLEPMQYACFKCKYCIPPEAMTILTSRYPTLISSTLSNCEFQVSQDSWPVVTGEYTVLDKSAPVAVSTLASSKLEEKLAKSKTTGLCIVGKTETENIGIDKIVKNVVTNPAIKFLIIAGKDSEGHQSGKTLLALWENGVDDNMRVIGSPGRRPILKNVTLSEINAFRKQIQVDNQIGCEDIKIITDRVRTFSNGVYTSAGVSSCGCHECGDQSTVAEVKTKLITSVRAKKISPPRSISNCGCTSCDEPLSVPKIKAESPKSIKLDKAGYFVIFPSKKDKSIIVEHYSYDNKLLRTIEGRNSRDIYHTIISNRWVTDLSHAAYLGKELTKAELSIKKGFKYIQDGA